MGNIKFTKWQKLDRIRDEQINTLYTNLSFTKKDLKVIGVVSALQNEGKTFVSMELFRKFAEDGKKIIMVDGDLRKSRIASRYSDIKHEEYKGLSQYLLRKCSIEDIILHSDVSNADVILAGQYVSNPMSLFTHDEFSKLIEHLKKCYDIVLIDMPPINLVIDGAIIGKQCDGVLLVVKSNVTTYKDVQVAQKQLLRAKVNILGVCLNKVSDKKNDYYYSKDAYYSDGEAKSIEVMKDDEHIEN